MAIFNGKYRWDGIKKGQQTPIAWSGGSYNLKLFKCPIRSDKVQLLKQFVCIYAQTGEGQSISANPEKFAKQICDDFSLDLDRVLWVEDLQTVQNRYEVVVFTKNWQMGDTVFYKIEKRMAMGAELGLIQRQLMSI